MYNCEQIFSLMNLNKSDLIKSTDDEYFAAVLRIATTTFTPNIRKHVSKFDQHHLSH